MIVALPITPWLAVLRGARAVVLGTVVASAGLTIISPAFFGEAAFIDEPAFGLAYVLTVVSTLALSLMLAVFRSVFESVALDELVQRVDERTTVLRYDWERRNGAGSGLVFLAIFSGLLALIGTVLVIVGARSWQSDAILATGIVTAVLAVVCLASLALLPRMDFPMVRDQAPELHAPTAPELNMTEAALAAWLTAHETADPHVVVPSSSDFGAVRALRSEAAIDAYIRGRSPNRPKQVEFDRALISTPGLERISVWAAAMAAAITMVSGALLAVDAAIAVTGLVVGAAGLAFAFLLARTGAIAGAQRRRAINARWPHRHPWFEPVPE